MHDPWTWTSVWGSTVGAGDGLDGGGQKGKNWDNYNRVTIKKKRRRKIKQETNNLKILSHFPNLL